jgi:hypothetical protein
MVSNGGRETLDGERRITDVKKTAKPLDKLTLSG